MDPLTGLIIIIGYIVFCIFWCGKSKSAGEGENHGEDRGYPYSRGK